ncbi:methyltransferase domain-containing protein [Yinghuangia sp. ASG 101]|uniref:methyltransferase domain-containing protein n=1 Tax=Yinghuangia sp. ASG 101 TaxID=2896848 RepID=UPI001E471630|nr:methyltransferase domain-containing protein [Yinghuangia sp. ASG 101]UGQ10046.1 methyltransferase domain-containing protein [Yinghuangia sp. ASG 101]
MSDRMRRRSSMRTAVVWQVLRDALERRVAAEGRSVLDVLDTGGGTGNFAVPIARLGHRVTVVDPSPDALAALERRAAEAGVTDLVAARQGDVQSLFDVVDRGAADAVLCHGVLELVDEPDDALGTVAAALRDGGTLSLLAANRTGAVLARALAGHFAEAAEALADPTALPRRFTVDELTALLAKVGLRPGAVHAVRVFADLVPGVLVDDPASFDALLDLEKAAAELPEYRSLATQVHLLAAK